MSETLIVAPGDTAILSLTLPSPVTTLYPTARVYNAAGALTDTINLAPGLPDGRYTGAHVCGVAGRYSVHYAVYTDVARTVLSTDYGADQDTIITDLSAVWDVPRTAASGAGTFGEAMRIILGMSKSDYRIDNMSYNAVGFLLSCRVRVFPDATTAAASTSGGTGEGEVFTLTMAGTPDVGLPLLPSTVLGLRP